MTKEIKAPVNKIIDHSVVDGRGNRTAVFLQGCNFNCSFCHNPETIDPLDKTVEITWMTAEEVFDAVILNTPFIRGVTVSGGECTLHPDFLFEFFKLIKEKGKGKGAGGGDLTTLIDSNGAYNFEKDEKLLTVLDGVMLDIKAYDEKTHMKITGASNKQALKNLVFLAERGKLEEIRVVVIPDVTDTVDIIKEAGKLLSEKEKGVILRLIKYRPIGVRKEMLKGLKVPKQEYMEDLKALSESLGFKRVIIT